ncbi:hypothetical protein [Pseudoalteromonas nigrifaciens]|uniref:hypothetical protein n=1 Tax=Pseudoalteromonas nigrifaciens TaxID=28109 RepID=UPI003FD3E065
MKVKSKRKAVLPTESVIKPPASVYQLRVEDISLSAGKHKNVHFKRLRYFGCPVLKRGTNNFPDGTLLRNMNRDQFIREMYCLRILMTLITDSHQL